MGRAYQYVILGGGTAAGYAASEFVKRGVPRGDLCIISEETVPPYERPALSKGYLMPGGAVRLPVFHTCVGVGEERHTAKWYSDHGIDLLLGTRVVGADVKRRRLATAAGETIQYTTLIIATGARALRLEEFGVSRAAIGRVCYLRDLRDADQLLQAMVECRGGESVVIGGGYIGMEAAAALVANGIGVTMVFPEKHCMPRLFTPEIAAFYERVYADKGVRFIKGSVIVAFDRDKETNNVSSVILKDGQRIPAAMVVVGIGIRPNTALFEAQLAMEQGGIRTSPRMQTSDASVYAIGDVAAVPLRLYSNARRRLEHVDHARKSASAAVSAILSPRSAPSHYAYLPYFYSRVFDLSWQFYGDNVGECAVFGDTAATAAAAAAAATGPGAPEGDGSLNGSQQLLPSCDGSDGATSQSSALTPSAAAADKPITPSAAADKPITPSAAADKPSTPSAAAAVATSSSPSPFASRRSKAAGPKLGAYWVDKGRLVGVFLEGGTKLEYEAMAAAARARPAVVGGVAELARQGTTFLLQLVASGKLQVASADGQAAAAAALLRAQRSGDEGKGNPRASGSGSALAGLGGHGVADSNTAGGSGVVVAPAFPPDLLSQTAAGVAIAVGIVALAYWHGHRLRKLW